MTTKTIIVCGYGPGISDAVARRFGEEGFAVALVSRTEEKVEAGAAALAERGLEARGFVCDLADAGAVSSLVADVREALGPIAAIHWNAYAGVAGDLTACAPAEVTTSLEVGVTGLVAAVQAALPDLEARDDGAVLVTGGGFAFYDPKVDAMATQWNAMGLAITKAAQHKAAGLLHAKLKPRGVFVGEVIVLGMVEGTALDQGGGGIAPDAIAAKFWDLFEARDAPTARIG